MDYKRFLEVANERQVAEFYYWGRNRPIETPYSEMFEQYYAIANVLLPLKKTEKEYEEMRKSVSSDLNGCVAKCPKCETTLIVSVSEP